MQRHIKAQAAGPQQLHAEDHGADDQHQPGERLGELVQLDLQGRLSLDGLGQRAGDLAHFRIHAGGGDHYGGTAIGHGAAHIDHVFPVAQRDILCALRKIDDVDKLGHGDGFAGEGGFLHLQAGAFQNAAVCGDGIAGLQQNDITHHQILAVDGDGLAVPQHPGGGGRHLLQRLDGLFRLVFLINAQDCVDDDHRQNDDHIGEALVLHHGQNAADGGGRQQDEDHGVGHLLKKAQDQGLSLFRLQAVLSVFLQPPAGFLRGEALFRGFQRLQHGLLLTAIVLHKNASFP